MDREPFDIDLRNRLWHEVANAPSLVRRGRVGENIDAALDELMPDPSGAMHINGNANVFPQAENAE